MATKPSDLFDRLPSVNELLEKPPVRALADRWNRSTVAAGVRSFLDELRQDLERRAADLHLPSLRDLAERAARHVAAAAAIRVRPAINATGQFIGPHGRPRRWLMKRSSGWSPLAAATCQLGQRGPDASRRQRFAGSPAPRPRSS